MAQNNFFLQKIAYQVLSKKRSLTLYNTRTMPIQMTKGEDKLYHSAYYIKPLSCETILFINALLSKDIDRAEYLLTYRIKSIDFENELVSQPHLVYLLTDLACNSVGTQDAQKALEFLEKAYETKEIRKLFFMADKYDISPFVSALREGHESVIEFFLQKGLHRPGDHALSRIFMRMEIDKVSYDRIESTYKLLKRYGADINALGLEGQTLLYHAALNDSADKNNCYGKKLQFLLKQGADIHQKNIHGQHVIEALADTKHMLALSNFTFLIDFVQDISLLQSTYDKIQKNSVFLNRPEALSHLSGYVAEKIAKIEKKVITEALVDVSLTHSEVIKNSLVARKTHKI